MKGIDFMLELGWEATKYLTIPILLTLTVLALLIGMEINRRKSMPKKSKKKFAICDNCRKAFRPNPKEKLKENGELELYFTCPKCKKDYTILIISEKGQEIRKQLQQALKEHEQATTAAEVFKKSQDINRLRNEYERETWRSGIGKQAKH